jgi:hypothetical protein
MARRGSTGLPAQRIGVLGAFNSQRTLAAEAE